MDSLEQNDVYKVLGCTLGDDKSPAPDAIAPKLEFPQSEDDGLAHNDPAEDPNNNELELRLDKEMEQSLYDTQPVMSLQTADDINLEMDMDLQEHVEALDEGDGTDNSDTDTDESDFFC
ncbi:hypothetical protein EDB92DRAFT_1948686 [Lactarius akahatsu]|uniref:Uncharacterized protein n=1 Tax=Lactarius akahatsu TaxID=416441 RepID=A0AAD4LDI9_9AGAM|nr:hypothetical protein EDB92DRAFT_1948686 [Lactarius akahatsu]